MKLVQIMSTLTMPAKHPTMLQRLASHKGCKAEVCFCVYFKQQHTNSLLCADQEHIDNTYKEGKGQSGGWNAYKGC